MIKISPRLEFHEAIERARERAQAQRALLPDDYYGDLPVSLRSHAFTVSGLARLDQINAVADSLAEALAQGDGFAEWKKRALTDPDLAALPRGRLETIYRNAVQTAYHAGRWQQFEQAKRRRPFLMYDAINDQRTRPDHRALDGYIAPVDDPVWDTIAPPNGHNCRCSLIGLTQAQAEARGWTGSAQPPSGEPDPGWEHNPARNHIDQLETLLAEREATAAVQPATPALRRGATPDAATLMGRPLLDEIMREARLQDGATIEQALDAGMDAEAAEAFRIATVERLRATRALGGTPATVQKSGKCRAALLKAAALLPAEWVTYGNAVSIDVEYSEQRAHYQSATTKRKRAAWVTAATIRADDTSSMLHEYMHHLQKMVPGLDDVFQAEHRRRTLGEALVVLYAIRPRETGRRDGYVEPYQGREYDDGGALEVLTMAFETLLGGHLGGRRDRSRLWLANSLRKDLRMLEIALGMLFYYSP